VGDPIYLLDHRVGEPMTLSVNEPPLCLHAAAIKFTHPLTKSRVKYEAAGPGWTQSRMR
jgi:23S rRNA-/tRNA-specific pseudouridylate synthase